MMSISRRLWRFRWHGLVLAWCIAIVGWGWISFQPSRYQATAQVYVNANSSLEVFRGGLKPDQLEFTVSDMLKQSLIDRQQLDKVIRAAGPLQESGSGGKDRAVNQFLERIKITASAKWENLFLISYSSTSRRNALAVVEVYASTVAEDVLGASHFDENDAPGEQDNEVAPRFRLVDPPAVDLASWPPNRATWILLILLIGLSAGGGLANWLSLRNPVFDTVEQISAVAGVPVAGAVTHAWMAQANAQRRRDQMLFGAGTGGLILCFAIVLSV